MLQASAQPFLILGLLVTALATSHWYFWSSLFVCNTWKQNETGRYRKIGVVMLQFWLLCNGTVFARSSKFITVGCNVLVWHLLAETFFFWGIIKPFWDYRVRLKTWFLTPFQLGHRLYDTKRGTRLIFYSQALGADERQKTSYCLQLDISQKNLKAPESPHRQFASRWRHYSSRSSAEGSPPPRVRTPLSLQLLLLTLELNSANAHLKIFPLLLPFCA